MNTPTIARVVLYSLTKEDADAINTHRIRTTVPEAVQRHLGSHVFEEEQFPAVVTRVHPSGRVNLKVLLDGNDDLWLIEVDGADEPKKGHWNWPVREPAPQAPEFRLSAEVMQEIVNGAAKSVLESINPGAQKKAR